jgi:hypothetical protein
MSCYLVNLLLIHKYVMSTYYVLDTPWHTGTIALPVTEVYCKGHH